MHKCSKQCNAQQFGVDLNVVFSVCLVRECIEVQCLKCILTDEYSLLTRL